MKKLLLVLCVLGFNVQAKTVNSVLMSDYVEGSKRICVYTYKGNMYTKVQNKSQYCRNVMRVED